jgi:protein tyrosine/serine phosphatase
MKTRSTEWIFAAALMAVMILLSGCSLLSSPATDFGASGPKGLSRFDQVDKDVYRSAQPDLDQLREMVARNHIRTVVKLNGGSDPVSHDVKTIHRTLYGPITPSAEKIREILQQIHDAPKPVLIHCTHGEDRTGLIVALYKVCKKTARPLELLGARRRLDWRGSQGRLPARG